MNKYDVKDRHKKGLKIAPVILITLLVSIFMYISIDSFSSGIKTRDIVSFIVSGAFLTLSIILIIMLFGKLKLSFILFLNLLIIVGICMLFGGIFESYKKSIATKDYISITAKCTNKVYYDLIMDGNDNISRYNVTYTYIVNDIEYTMNRIEQRNQVGFARQKLIKYNPNNPAEATIAGPGAGTVLLVIGPLFIFVPIVFLSIFFERKSQNKTSLADNQIFISIGLIIMGGITYYIMSNTTFSLIFAFKANGFLILIPLAFLIVGAWNLIYCIYYRKRK